MTTRDHRRPGRRFSRLVVAAVTLGLLVGVTPSTAAYADPVGVPPSGKPGTLLAWGLYGLTASTVPVELRHRLFKAVASASTYNLALTTDGKVVVWGGQDRAADLTALPASLTGKTVTAIAADGSHALALTSAGTVIAWGDDTYGQTTVPAALAGKTVVAIAAGNRHSLALTDTGAVVAWGSNSDGQTAVPASLAGAKVTAISAGYAHSLALTAAGTVVGWGSNYVGESVSPPGLTGKKVTAVSAGRYGSLALTDDQAVVAWGNDEDNQLSIASPAGSGAVALAATSQYNIVLYANGAIQGAGYTGYGEQFVPPAVQDRFKLAVAANSSIHVALAEPKVVFVPPDSLNPDNGQSATIGLPYRYTYFADGYPAPTITVASGSLPPGLTLAPDGTISGTPTAYGDYPFTLHAQNPQDPADSDDSDDSDDTTITFDVGTRTPTTLTAVSGGGQTTTPGQPFAQPLVAKVTDDNGYPSSWPVLVTVPTTPGAPTFIDGSSTAQLHAEAGVVTSPTIVAGQQVGTFTVTAKLVAPLDTIPAVSYTLTVAAPPPPPPPTPKADLSVRLVAPAQAKTTRKVTVAVQVIDLGPDAASGVQTRLTLPDGWKVKDAAGGTVDKDVITWSRPTLAAAGSATYEVVLKAGKHRGRDTLAASTGSSVTDPASGNNRASVEVRLTR